MSKSINNNKFSPHSRRDLRWRERYNELEDFKRKYRHTRVPYEWKGNPVLANWAHHQRSRKNNLALWKEELLKAIEFEFVLRKSKKSELKVRENKHLLKIKKALQEKIILTTEDIENFTIFDYQWYYRYAELLKFIKKYGHSRVKITDQQYKSLASWVNRIRRDRRKLSRGKIKLLIEAGFIWSINEQIEQTPWETRYKELLEYKKQCGHTNVPQKHSELGRWVWMQRRDFKNGTITMERYNLLTRIGFIWKFNSIERSQRTLLINEKRWMNRYNELKIFKKHYGHCIVPQHWSENPKLGTWVSRQRGFYKHSLLPPDRIKLLDLLDFY